MKIPDNASCSSSFPAVLQGIVGSESVFCHRSDSGGASANGCRCAKTQVPAFPFKATTRRRTGLRPLIETYWALGTSRQSGAVSTRKTLPPGPSLVLQMSHSWTGFRQRRQQIVLQLRSMIARGDFRAAARPQSSKLHTRPRSVASSA